jgi:hypothetical protein
VTDTPTPRPEPARPTLTDLDYFVVYGTKPSWNRHGQWLLRGTDYRTSEPVSVDYTGTLAALDLPALGAGHPGVHLWHVITFTADQLTDVHADTVLPPSDMEHLLSVEQILQAAADSGLSDGELEHVAVAVAGALGTDSPAPAVPVVWETIVRLSETRRTLR